MSDRQTVSEEPLLILDPEERAAAEAENALLQFDRVLDLIDMAVRDGQPFRLRPSTILALHAEAMRGVHRQAGTWRNTHVEIEGSQHQPPAEHLVVVSVEDMCDWVNRSSDQQHPDLGEMVNLLEEYLAKQLQAVLAAATQAGATDSENRRKFH